MITATITAKMPKLHALTLSGWLGGTSSGIACLQAFDCEVLDREVFDREAFDREVLIAKS